MNLKDTTIGIIGAGTVGSAIGFAFKEHVEYVAYYDIDPILCSASLDATLGCNIIFVCLPTPPRSRDDWRCDTGIIEQFFSDRVLNDVRPHANANFVLKSTVPIGFTRSLREKYNLSNLVHSPEFLTARTAFHDAANPVCNYIGTTSNVSAVQEVVEGPDGNKTVCNFPTQICTRTLHRLYKARWPHIPVYTYTSDETEAIKLYTNAAYATKIGLFNELRSHADALGLDWQRVLNGMLAQGRIGDSHTQVPGPDGKRGFGGACLPKDVASLMMQMYDIPPPHYPSTDEVQPSILSAVRFRNCNIDRPEDYK